MNLHAAVRGLIGRVNPDLIATYEASAGNTVDANFFQVPDYAAPASMVVQRQPMTFRDLQMLDGVNLNGEAIALYCNGDITGVRRPDGKGGDRFTLPDGSQWLVTHVLENFNATAGWTKVACVRQMAS